MELSPQGIVAYITTFIDTLPSEIMEGDVFALTITLIAFFIAVVVINKLTGLLIVFLKKIILFLIVTLAFWQFLQMFYWKMTTEGMTTDTMIFGAGGFVIGFVAISTSLYVALYSWMEAREKGAEEGTEPEIVAEVPVKGAEGVKAAAPPAGPGATEALKGVGLPATPDATATPSAAPAPEVPAAQPALAEAAPAVAVTGTPPPAPAAAETPAPEEKGRLTAMRESLSVSSIKSDKSLGAVLAYLVIAQFGVFSSKTMPAPSFQVGIAFFVIFLIAGLFFIHFTYHNYLTGVRHLFMAIVVGTVIALILGYFWGNIPLDTLLSPAFFQTDALVALVTGLALSLFMGGKG